MKTKTFFIINVDTINNNKILLNPWLIFDDENVYELVDNMSNMITTEELIRKGYLNKEDITEAENDKIKNDVINEAYMNYFYDISVNNDNDDEANEIKKEMKNNITEQVNKFTFAYKLKVMAKVFEAMLKLGRKFDNNFDIDNTLAALRYNVITDQSLDNEYIDAQLFANVSAVNNEDVVKLNYFLKLLMKYIKDLYKSQNKEIPHKYEQSEKIIKKFTEEIEEKLSN